MEGAVTTTVCRGSDHKPLEETEFDKRAQNIPRALEGFSQERALAQTHLDATITRYENLASHHYYDLDKYLNEILAASRSNFDRQFLADRAQAIKDQDIIQMYMLQIKDLERAEGLRVLAHMSSDFGSISGDGGVSSLGSGHLQAKAVKQKVKQPDIIDYINEIDEKNFVSPFSPKSEPTIWDDEPISTGDFQFQTMKEFGADKRKHLPR